MRTTESVIQEIKQVHGNKYIIPIDILPRLKYVGFLDAIVVAL